MTRPLPKHFFESPCVCRAAKYEEGTQSRRGRPTALRDGLQWVTTGEIVLVTSFISPSVKSFQVVTEK